MKFRVSKSQSKWLPNNPFLSHFNKISYNGMSLKWIYILTFLEIPFLLLIFKFWKQSYLLTFSFNSCDLSLIDLLILSKLPERYRLWSFSLRRWYIREKSKRQDSNNENPCLGDCTIRRVYVICINWYSTHMHRERARFFYLEKIQAHCYSFIEYINMCIFEDDARYTRKL